MTLNMNDSEPGLRAAAELIADADALIIAAGAGMGVDSGLPDFRGNEGFWRAYPALANGAFLNRSVVVCVNIWKR